MERVINLDSVRRVHRIGLSDYGHPQAYAYWCEWAHPQIVDDRDLTHIVAVHARIWNWSKFITPGSTCIDVGAHSGDTVIPMAVCAYGGADRRGVVLAVEPNTKVLPVLEVNMLLNAPLADLYVVNRAVTETPTDEVEISDHGNWDCNGGIIDDNFSDELQSHLKQIVGSTIKVPGSPLKDICNEVLSEEQLSKLSFIKTDCEGYDKQILRSSFDLIDRYKPTLFVEWFNYFKEADSADLFEAIREIGYVAYHPMTGEAQPVETKIDDLILLPRNVDPRDRFSI